MTKHHKACSIPTRRKRGAQYLEYIGDLNGAADPRQKVTKDARAGANCELSTANLEEQNYLRLASGASHLDRLWAEAQEKAPGRATV